MKGCTWGKDEARCKQVNWNSNGRRESAHHQLFQVGSFSGILDQTATKSSGSAIFSQSALTSQNATAAALKKMILAIYSQNLEIQGRKSQGALAVAKN